MTCHQRFYVLNLLSTFLLLLMISTQTLIRVSAQTNEVATLVEPSYAEIIDQWQAEFKLGPLDFQESFFLADQTPASTADVWEKQDAFGYEHAVVHLADGKQTTLQIEVPATGLYQLSFDYYRLNEGLIEPEFALKVNGEYPYYESRRVIAKSLWTNATDDFPVNNYGNEMIPAQVALNQWNTRLMYDPNFEQANPLLIPLNAGENTLEIIHQSGEFLMGQISLQTPVELLDYSEYLAQFTSTNATNATNQAETLLTVEAEKPAFKSDSYIRPIAQKNIAVHPYDPASNLLNTFGGDSWQRGGQRVTWEIEVPEAGLYQITLKSIQRNKQKAPVFRNIYLNGAIPFAQMQHYRINPSDQWENQTLTDSQGVPYEFYLEAGTNQLSLEVDVSPMTPVIGSLTQMMQEINQLGLELSQLTGNRVDANRDWQIMDYMPDLIERFDGWIVQLEADYTLLDDVYNQAAASPDQVTLQVIINRLRTLKEDPNDLPNKLGELSQGTGSITQAMGNLIVELQKGPLLLDQIFVHQAQADLPAATASWTDTLTSKAQEFYYSFAQPSLDISDVEEGTIEVWVGRSQPYVEIMQAMVDREFTQQTGIDVKLSVMPNESKIILANSANQQPDVALGVSVGQPFELAIRNAALNLSQFEDFDEVSQRFSPGAFLPLMLDDQAYGLPETQDFYVLFYREDIMEQLGLPIPNTWQDVINILPELQRAGMNFYIPLSSTAGMKPFMFTAPFIYQFGGEIYAEDGMSTAIGSEASLAGIKFMTDLYTLYSIPLQVPNFYNSFRYGELPIGISNFQTYVQLTSAAPEIRNSWKLALYPGIPQEDGAVNRETTGSAQTAMIFNKSEHQDESWAFLKWWTSADVQIAFASEIQTAYGPEFMWHTANLEAFSQLPWPEEDKAIILEQWEQLREVPKIPGSYMIEREISNVWSDVVFYGSNLRATVDRSSVYADREVRKKMTEFGYLENEQVVKPYRIPTVETVESWGD
ncbi:extracellular solute-binding protein [Fundicoccus culcitae]|uniref:Extracellular solute-binding protein n=1 Tax=Fundicoccus culcitae TaxID=2969821 RepID=A0ABY5P9F7_9LACT|nr:extracellular solute-binding protein [Fundicoccus culcitae]UUX34993.1 extracellular solute-binding protein [Fundicoccus culcitae]